MIGIIVFEKRFITEMICQPMIYCPVGDGEKSSLCFNDLNTPKFKFLYYYCKPNLWKVMY